MSLHALTVSLLVSALAAPGVPPGRAAKGSYLYDVSDNTGPVPSSWASLYYDPEHKELYVVDRSDGTVGIFNDGGMELYRFGQDSAIGTIIALAVLEDGDLMVLTSNKGHPMLFRCNFRGEPRGRVEWRNLPSGFETDFWPDAIAARAGKLYLAQKGALKVLVTDLAGNTLAAHDYFHELGFDKMRSARGGIPAMQSFYVDPDGTMLFAIAPLFKAFLISPGGKLTAFGERGGSPGRFNVVGGMTRDPAGNLLLTDVLRGVVMVFSPTFEFLGEFAGRGWAEGQLIAPLEVAAGGGKAFVSQSAGRGVSVFRYDVPGPQPAPAAAATTPSGS